LLASLSQGQLASFFDFFVLYKLESSSRFFTKKTFISCFNLFKRIYFGGQICDLINPDTNKLYAPVTQNSLTCRLGGSEVNRYNTSMIVNMEFGRSLTSPTSFLVSPDEQSYNFQTYSEVTSVSAHSGSTNGGTLLTINGLYFFNSGDVPATIDISGKIDRILLIFSKQFLMEFQFKGSPCELVNFEINDGVNTRIQCNTGAEPALASSDYVGGRGISLHVLNQKITPTTTISSSAVKSIIDSASYTSNTTTAITIWLEGYLSPQKNSEYRFDLIGNADASVLYISTDHTAANKVSLYSWIFLYFQKKNFT
jgi:hypothetical protein